jgi:U3 small nucleolar RNA-associated protein 25
VKEVDSDESGNDAPPEESEEEMTEDDEDDEEEEVAPAGKAYGALLASLKRPEDDEGRSRKRRKLEAPAEVPMVAEESGDESNAEPGLEVDEASDDDDEDDEEAQELAAAADASSETLQDDDEEDASDYFEAHFANPDDNELTARLKDIQNAEWRTEKQSVYQKGSLTLTLPKSSPDVATRRQNYKSTSDIPLKQKLVETAKKHIGTFDDVQRTIAPHMLSYTDLLVANRTAANAESLRNLACMHALNHVLKGRDKIMKNTARIAHTEGGDALELRDQGFTRPKVLILLETREMAARYADCIVDLFAPEQQENKQRFKDSFTAPIDENDTMPEDYRELFAGNNDNNFLTAIKFTRKTLKFFSAFYSSDIIVASPLGLRRIIDHEDRRKKDHDFLSSIEMVVVDQADAMQMQNWENVELVFKHLNLQPKDLHGCDVNRVRSWYLDGNAKHFRQTICFSNFVTPEMNRMFNSDLVNIAGKAKLTPSHDGAITSVTGLGFKQTFSRFNALTPAADPDARFKYFTTAVLPALMRLPKPADGAPGIMIFIPSYFDFLRVRNFFATSDLTANISFGAIHDYTEVADQRRARSHFMSGRHAFLLYTQRAHHFFRLKIRGVKRVVLYGLPDNEIFYREIVGGYLGTTISEGKVSPEEAGARALFSRWDGMRTERVVGSDRVRGMLGGAGDTFDFL